MKLKFVLFVCCCVTGLPLIAPQSQDSSAATGFRLPHVFGRAPFSLPNILQPPPRPTETRRNTAPSAERTIFRPVQVLQNSRPDNPNRPLALPITTNLGQQALIDAAPLLTQPSPTAARPTRAQDVNINNSLAPIRQVLFAETASPTIPDPRQPFSFPSSQVVTSSSAQFLTPAASLSRPLLPSPSANVVHNSGPPRVLVQSGFLPTSQFVTQTQSITALRHQTENNLRNPSPNSFPLPNNLIPPSGFPTVFPRAVDFLPNNSLNNARPDGTQPSRIIPNQRTPLATSPLPPKLSLDCGASNDMGYCSMTDKYPKSFSQEVADRCRDKMKQMYVEVPEDFEALGERGAAVVYANFSRFSKDVQPWSWAAYTKESACDSELRFVRPALAKDKRGRWMVVIQTDEFVQRVAVDVCRKPDGVCRGYTDCGRKSRCVQRYSFHSLIAMDQENLLGCPEMTVFKFPTSCNCHVETNKLV